MEDKGFPPTMGRVDPSPRHDYIDISQLINTFNAIRFSLNKNPPLLDSFSTF